MSEVLAVELPDDVARRAREIAAATNQSVEAVAVEWIRQAVEPAVESLPDAELLSLCDLMLEASRQDELSELLSRLRDGQLAEGEQTRLDQVMAEYRRGLVVKARAWKEAVARGLQLPLSGHAA
jgi:plasmid stability protein